MSHSKKKRVPKYSLHKASQLAVVRLNGKDVYRGSYGSEESHVEYERAIARWRTENGVVEQRRREMIHLNDPGVTIEELIFLYREFAKGYYVRDGKQTSKFAGMHCVP